MSRITSCLPAGFYDHIGIVIEGRLQLGQVQRVGGEIGIFHEQAVSYMLALCLQHALPYVRHRGRQTVGALVCQIDRLKSQYGQHRSHDDHLLFQRAASAFLSWPANRASPHFFSSVESKFRRT